MKLSRQQVILLIVTLTTTALTFILSNKNLSQVQAQSTTPTVDTHIADLNQPVAFEWLPNGELLIGEKAGALKMYHDGGLSTIATLPVNSDSERGLLGIAVDPLFSQNNHIYLFYTTTTPHNRVSRFTLQNNQLTDEVVLIDEIYTSSPGRHNGGDLQFDNEGILYISTGDGGGGTCADCAQDITKLNGKILKIDPLTGIGLDDNPFASNPHPVAQKVWAYGLRNPFRFAIHPQTNEIYIADVGESQFEELNKGIPGANYGWPRVEGPFPADLAGMTYPLFIYARNGNTEPSFNNCRSITGGVFQDNTYIFSDFTCGNIWTKDITNASSSPTLLVPDAGNPVHFGVGPDQSIYFSDIGSGSIKRIKTDSPTPSTTASPAISASLQPTVTPTSTSTPTPSNSPTPTSTADPTVSPTTNPSFTPQPTPSAIATPSTTPSATSSGVPTASPVATNTPTTKTTIVIYAMGDEGGGEYPDLQLVINDEPVAQATTTDSIRRYIINYPGNITIEQIKINYPNDYWEPISGDDRNLRIDKIIINDQTYETEEQTTYSVGSWRAEDTCAPGHKASEWIHCPGYVQFATQRAVPELLN